MLLILKLFHCLILRRHQQDIDLTLQKIDTTVRQHLSRLVKTWEEIGLDKDAVNLRFTQCQAHVNVSYFCYVRHVHNHQSLTKDIN
jgi:hypothetical protein